ncbi:fungal-specific transcription factor domain-containing protein, partial [Coprinopsis sp. MPI-PUGE-AT-0042]
MGHRIGQLEDALAIFQSTVSEQTHPLLRDDLLAIKSPFGPNNVNKEKPATSSSKPRVEQTTAAFGTLSIGDEGEGKYFGPSAGSEAGANLELSEVDEEESPAEVAVQIARILASDGNTERAMDLLFNHLPDQPRAWSLCETYLEQGTWATKALKRDEIIEDILSPTYKALKGRNAEDSPVASFSPHKLCVLYMIFALGALVDLTLEPCSREAEHYYHLSRACLSLRSVFDSPEISTVQGLFLMGGYHGWAGTRYTVDSSWGLISLSAKVAQSVLGLDRDPSRFDLDAKTMQRRRTLFWEIFASENLYCLALGRPPSIRMSYVDCQFPADDQDQVDASLGYCEWKYSFARDIMSVILEKTVTAVPPTYETILDLDRLVREKALPAHLNVFAGPEESGGPSKYMRHCFLGVLRAIALLYIHRNFFAQAILDHPENPLRSPYAPSFLATYRCASGIIKSSMNHYERFPQLCGRWWGLWTNLFSAAMIVGCIVTRSPSCSLASSAYIELGLACDLFQKAVSQSRRSRSGLAILYKIRRRASEVYSQHASGGPAPTGGILSTGQPDYGEDELALFGGQTKVMVSKLLSQYRKRSKRSSVASPSASSNSNSSASTPEMEPRPNLSNQVADVHPRLVEYLSMYPPSNHSSPPQDQATGSDHLSEPKISLMTAQGLQTANQSYMANGSHPQQPMSWWNQGQPMSAPPIDMNSNQTAEYYASPLSAPVSVSNNRRGEYGFDPQFVQENASGLADIGMMLSGDAGMDQQWLSFMRDSGFLDNNDIVDSRSRQPMFGKGDMVGIL